MFTIAYQSNIYAEQNSKEELIQRCAWRLVRSSENRHGSGGGRGPEKLLWAVDHLKKEFPDVSDRAEDYIRAAFENYKVELNYSKGG